MTAHRIIRRLVAVALTAVTAAAVLPVVDVPVASALNPNLFTLQGEAGDYIIGPQSLSYNSFTVLGSRTGVTVSVPFTQGISNWWDVRLNPPSGTTLTPGFYEDATRAGVGAPGMPGLDVSGSGRGCNTVTGRFVIDDITFNPDDTVASLVAHWEEHCEGGISANVGTVSWNSSTPLSPMNTVAPGDFSGVSIDTASATKPQVINNPGATPLAVTNTAITGTESAQFEIVSDPCSGTSIPAGGSCAVQVRFVPTQMGVSKANLTVIDTAHPAGQSMPVRGKGTVRVGSFWREGESGDYLVRPQHQSFPVLTITATPSGDRIDISTVDLHTTIGSADGSPLQAGVYEGAESPFFPSAGHPKFDQYGQGRACAPLTGRFIIDQISWGTNGVLSRLVVRWEIHCSGLIPANFGAVNYNGTVPFVERSITPAVNDFGALAVAAPTPPQTVTVSNTGPSPLHVASATLTGTHPDQFGITADTCSGATVPAGGTCTVSVRYAPTRSGQHEARLSIVDDVAQAIGGGTGQDVVLTGLVSGTTTSTPSILYVEGEADDSMVGAAHFDLTDVQVLGNNTDILIIGLDGTDQWTTAIGPPLGSPFVAGASNFATQQNDLQDANHGGLSVFLNNETCATSKGRLEIDELTFNVDGTVQSLVARWEYHCNGEAAASFGGVRYNSASNFTVTDLTDIATWEQVPNGTSGVTQDIVLSSTGTASTSVGAVTLAGPDASQFSVVSDGCSNITVPALASCTVKVKFAPTSATIGEKVARLVVPHTGALLGAGGTGQDVLLLGSNTVAANSNFGELTLVNPARLLDTTTGLGGARAPLGPKKSLIVQVTGRGGVPTTGVGAVIVNITSSRSTSSASNVTVWPASTTRPGVSTLFPVPGVAVSNLATVRPGIGGRIQVYNAAGNTDLSIDVVGWYSNASGPNGARFHTLTPARAVNSTTGVGTTKAPVGPGATRKIDLRGKGGIPRTGSVAVALNVTAVRPTTSGSLTVFAGDRARPAMPALSFTPGVTVSNMVIVRLPASGIVQFFNSAGNTQLAVDVLGYWTLTASGNAGRYVPVTPARAFDTRKLGAPQSAASREAYQIAGWDGIAHDAGAAVMNVVAVKPTSAGFLRVLPDQVCTMPGTSSVNYVLGRTVANGVFSSLSPGVQTGCAIAPGAVDVFNNVGTTHVMIDVSGYFTP